MDRKPKTEEPSQTLLEETEEKRNMIVVGPWGGNGGCSWDDGCFTGVRAITLKSGYSVDSIQVIYDKRGQSFIADMHGGPGGKTHEIRLEYPNELLIGVSGYYKEFCGSMIIRSLRFKSNVRTFGPYGFEEGTPFTFSIEGGKVVGLKGRSGSYLDSIAFTIS